MDFKLLKVIPVTKPEYFCGLSVSDLSKFCHLATSAYIFPSEIFSALTPLLLLKHPIKSNF
jgi:hypothetical protein